jgi:hypothetical protein
MGRSRAELESGRERLTAQAAAETAARLDRAEALGHGRRLYRLRVGAPPPYQYPEDQVDDWGLPRTAPPMLTPLEQQRWCCYGEPGPGGHDELHDRSCPFASR